LELLKLLERVPIPIKESIEEPSAKVLCVVAVGFNPKMSYIGKYISGLCILV